MKILVAVRTVFSVRRWPILTLGLLLMNTLLFAFIHHRDEQRELQLAERGVLALAYFQQHPYLTLKPPLSEFGELGTGSRAALNSNTGNVVDMGSLVTLAGSQTQPEDSADVLREQAELDGKVAAFADVAAKWQSSSLGYVPANPEWWSLISYLFVHGSWVHLLGNLSFLLLVGCWLEMSWGTRPLAVLYVTAGIVAALSHYWAASRSVVPLVGASGAIAGLLGACAMVAATLRARLDGSDSLVIRAGHSLIPVLLMLWFTAELVQASFFPRHEGMVSHFAHVGGFASGVIFAILASSKRLLGVMHV